MSLPRFHVFVPTFQAESALEGCLRSILDQRGAFDLHVHVQDGGSSDGVAHRVQQARNRGRTDGGPCQLTFCVETDSGPSDAVARAIARTDVGPRDWLCWLSADERFAPGALQAVASLVERKRSLAFIHGRTALERPRPIDRAALIAGLYDGRFLPRLTRAAVMWRGDLAARVGGPDPALGPAAAWDFWRRLAREAEPVTVDVELTLSPPLDRGAAREDARYAVIDTERERPDSRFASARDAWISRQAASGPTGRIAHQVGGAWVLSSVESGPSGLARHVVPAEGFEFDGAGRRVLAGRQGCLVIPARLTGWVTMHLRCQLLQDRTRVRIHGDGELLCSVVREAPGDFKLSAEMFGMDAPMIVTLEAEGTDGTPGDRLLVLDVWLEAREGRSRERSRDRAAIARMTGAAGPQAAARSLRALAEQSVQAAISGADASRLAPVLAHYSDLLLDSDVETDRPADLAIDLPWGVVLAPGAVMAAQRALSSGALEVTGAELQIDESGVSYLQLDPPEPPVFRASAGRRRGTSRIHLAIPLTVQTELALGPRSPVVWRGDPSAPFAELLKACGLAEGEGSPVHLGDEEGDDVIVVPEAVLAMAARALRFMRMGPRSRDEARDALGIASDCLVLAADEGEVEAALAAAAALHRPVKILAVGQPTRPRIGHAQVLSVDTHDPDLRAWLLAVADAVLLIDRDQADLALEAAICERPVLTSGARASSAILRSTTPLSSWEDDPIDRGLIESARREVLAAYGPAGVFSALSSQTKPLSPIRLTARREARASLAPLSGALLGDHGYEVQETGDFLLALADLRAGDLSRLVLTIETNTRASLRVEGYVRLFENPGVESVAVVSSGVPSLIAITLQLEPTDPTGPPPAASLGVDDVTSATRWAPGEGFARTPEGEARMASRTAVLTVENSRAGWRQVSLTLANFRVDQRLMIASQGRELSEIAVAGSEDEGEWRADFVAWLPKGTSTLDLSLVLPLERGRTDFGTLCGLQLAPASEPPMSGDGRAERVSGFDHEEPPVPDLNLTKRFRWAMPGAKLRLVPRTAGRYRVSLHYRSGVARQILSVTLNETVICRSKPSDGRIQGEKSLSFETVLPADGVVIQLNADRLMKVDRPLAVILQDVTFEHLD